MDNALREVSSENTQGVVIWFLELLWKTKTDKQIAQSRYHTQFPKIPDSIVFNFSRVHHWYFTPKAAKHCVKKHRRAKLTTRDIIDALGQGCEPHNGEDSTIVAQLMTRNPDLYATAGASAVELLDGSAHVQYLDYAQLSSMLLHNAITDTALLQRFVTPKSSMGNPVHNMVIRCRWQPNYCYFERRVNNHSLDDARWSFKERGETLEGVRHSSNVPLMSGVVIDDMKGCMNSIAEHLFFTSDLHVRHMTVVFKPDQNSELRLLWCQSIVVAKQDLATATVPYPLSAPSGVTPMKQGGAGGGLGATVGSGTGVPERATAKPKRPKERPSSSIGMPINKKLLDAEKEADRAFLHMTPCSWRAGSRRDFALLKCHRPNMIRARRSASRSGSLGGTQQQKRSTSPSTASNESGDGAFGGSMNNSKRPAPMGEADLLASSALSNSGGRNSPLQRMSSGLLLNSSECVNDAEWGVPGVVTNALLKHMSAEKYAKRGLATHAGRLGLRDDYIACMKRFSPKLPDVESVKAQIL